MTTAMVVKEQQAMAVWDRARIDLVKRTCCPAGISDDEFDLFMEQCKRTGLDPLIKQAFCVKRTARVGDQWIDVHTFQPAESGMLARAEDFPGYEGTTSGAVYAKDTIEIDAGAGTIKHVFSPASDRGALIGAWARVARAGRVSVVKWVLLKDYVQKKRDGTPSGQWADKPATMIQKCAKVAALRDAFPVVFGGIYINEEMREDGVAKPPEPAPTSRQISAPSSRLVGPEEGDVTDVEGEHAKADAPAAPAMVKKSWDEWLSESIAGYDRAFAANDVVKMTDIRQWAAKHFASKPEMLATFTQHVTEKAKAAATGNPPTSSTSPSEAA